MTKTQPRQVAVPYGSDPLTCPVRAWQAWKSAAGLDAEPESAAFRRIDRHGRMLGELSGEAAGAVVTRAADRGLGFAAITLATAAMSYFTRLNPLWALGAAAVLGGFGVVH